MIEFILSFQLDLYWLLKLSFVHDENMRTLVSFGVNIVSCFEFDLFEEVAELGQVGSAPVAEVRTFFQKLNYELLLASMDLYHAFIVVSSV